MPSSSTPVFHHTLFWYCNDVATMRHFYSDILNLEETFYRNDDEVGWLSYQSGSLQIVFSRSEVSQPVLQDWSVQFSYTEGNLYQPSWAVEIPYQDFEQTIKQIIDDGNIPYLEEDYRTPRDGHLCFWVRDPMGTTIEIYAHDPSKAT